MNEPNLLEDEHPKVSTSKRKPRKRKLRETLFPMTETQGEIADTPGDALVANTASMQCESVIAALPKIGVKCRIIAIHRIVRALNSIQKTVNVAVFNREAEKAGPELFK